MSLFPIMSEIQTFPFPLYCLKAPEGFFIPTEDVSDFHFWTRGILVTLSWLLLLFLLPDGIHIRYHHAWCCWSPHSRISLAQILVKAGQVLSNEDDSMDKLTLLVVQLTQDILFCTLLVPSLFRHTTESILFVF